MFIGGLIFSGRKQMNSKQMLKDKPPRDTNVAKYSIALHLLSDRHLPDSINFNNM